MRRQMLLTLLLATFLPSHSAAQEVDTNWDGPDVPEVRRLKDGGIEYTGRWIARRILVKRADIHDLHRRGFPRVVLNKDGQLYSVMTQKSIEHIDRFWGGDGHVPAYDGEIEIFNPDVWADEDRTAKLPDATDKVIKLDEIAERPGAIDLETVAAEHGPVELFSDADIDAINPLDGTWIAQVDDVTATGCPPGVEVAAFGMIGGAPANRVTFSKPWWSPGDFSAEFAAQTWRPVGANGYFSTPYKTGAEAEGSGMAMIVTIGLQARAPDRIAVWGRVNLELNAVLAQMAGGSQDCVAMITGEYRRQ